jgi:hypothetical protein
VAAFFEKFLQPQLLPTHRESLSNYVEQLQQIAAAVPSAGAFGSLNAMAQRPDRRAVLPEKTPEESLLPNYCTVLGLAGVGHLSFIERPADTRRAIR